ncbi:uncharacterized protein SAPINGB_P002204 [Magnusiomyces paraingens]|uniref:Pre-mRNA-splicing factor CWC15 n=1 Tax=Magnusiomyces paraingens TaxID=2606893 RepID=A0A5E8BE31_9ASCO|nr:uncharacterized protein SAPINGB_P002204 [Saprochaete ingens]VVT49304.1 unnamed protein product [Saprochaete ingens]
MTTAHRPTFDPAKGKTSQSTGSILHKRFLPSHTKLKVRGKGQGGVADRYDDGEPQEMDERERLRAALLAKEEGSGRATKRKALVVHGESSVDDNDNNDDDEDNKEQDLEEQGLVKRRRVLEVDPEDRDDDDRGDSGGSGKEENSDDDDDDDDDDEDEEDEDSEDEAEELRRELRKIEEERAERAKAEEEAEREREIAEGNPLLREGSSGTVTVRRRWYSEGVFADQARGLAVRPEDAPKHGFVNDALRSDFHRKFMDKYIR